MKINYLKSAYQKPEIQTETFSFLDTLLSLSTEGATIGDAVYENYGEI